MCVSSSGDYFEDNKIIYIDVENKESNANPKVYKDAKPRHNWRKIRPQFKKSLQLHHEWRNNRFHIINSLTIHFLPDPLKNDKGIVETTVTVTKQLVFQKLKG